MLLSDPSCSGNPNVHPQDPAVEVSNRPHMAKRMIPPRTNLICRVSFHPQDRWASIRVWENDGHPKLLVSA